MRTIPLLAFFASIALAACALEPDTDSGSTDNIVGACTTCGEWWADPAGVQAGTFCKGSEKLADELLDCIYVWVGDCPEVFRNETPTPECETAIPDYCPGELSSCEAH